jgi:hypothetical protein
MVCLAHGAGGRARAVLAEHGGRPVAAGPRGGPRRVYIPPVRAVRSRPGRRPVRRALVPSLVLMLLVSACGGGDVPAPPADGDAAAPAASDDAEAPTASTEVGGTAPTGCDALLAGRSVRPQPDEVLVCETGVVTAPDTRVGVGLPGRTATFWLSATGIGTTAGPTALNHPSSGASDGRRLVIADRFNNRVLVFTTLPTGPAVPDLVLGQPDTTSILPGDGLAQMNWPGAVELTPDGTLLVGDTENGRILVWRTLRCRSPRRRRRARRGRGESGRTADGWSSPTPAPAASSSGRPSRPVPTTGRTTSRSSREGSARRATSPATAARS